MKKIIASSKNAAKNASKNAAAKKSNKPATKKETTVKKDKKKPARKPKVQNHPVQDAVKAATKTLKTLPKKAFAKAKVSEIRDLYLAAKKAEGTKKYKALRAKASEKREALGLTLSQFIAVERKVLGLGN